MIFKHSSTRRIKNQSHTMSQSKVMGGKVKSVGQKKGSPPTTVKKLPFADGHKSQEV